MNKRPSRASRRSFLAKATGAGAASLLAPGPVGSSGALGFAELPDGALAEQALYALPGKVPLIKKTFRPPNFETPVEYFRTAVTPNKAFFVRYHLAGIPQVGAKEWSLSVGGESAERELKLGLAQLKSEFKPAQVTAVCQCSGNRRGLFEPHITGVEWGVGAMGNAVWRGVRLKDVLAKAGVKAGALEVVFDGADHPALEKTPDFVKSLPLEVALDDNTLVAYEMNGAPLPHWNGFPARLIVPGWTGTYWMKHLITINALTKPQGGFWMNPAYRVPLGKFPVVARFITQETAANTPITEMVVNSLITSHADGANVKAGTRASVGGIA